MGWREQLRPGRFRDAEFYVTGADTDIGRRNVLHEYPLRDTPFVEDLGRKAREFGLELFVLGQNYMAARDRLMAAIEQSGPGTLMHPWLGQFKVSVRGCRVRETLAEGGMAVFSVTFIEAGENRYPNDSADTRWTVNQRGDRAIGAISNEFAREHAVAGMPEFLSVASADISSQFLTAMSGMPGSQLFTPASSFAALIKSTSLNLGTIIRRPSVMAAALTSLIVSLRGLYADPTEQLRAQRRLHEFGNSLRTVPTTTYVRQQQARNQRAQVRLIRQAAVIESARSATRVQFANYNEAVAVRDELAEQLETHMQEADDLTYPELQALRSAVIRNINERGADLARVVHYTPSTTLPALVLAHQLYGDAAQEAALVARNRSIRHPGFVQGGTALEVLTDVA